MEVADANVLLHAVNRSHPHHDASRRWIDAALGDGEPVGFSWLPLLAFVRIATRPGIFPRPLAVDEALDRVRDWLSPPNAMVLEPTSRHLDVLAGLLLPTGTGGNLTSDAHLAALAVEHGATVVTYDSDYGRFPGVRWRTP